MQGNYGISKHPFYFHTWLKFTFVLNKMTSKLGQNDPYVALVGVVTFNEAIYTEDSDAHQSSPGIHLSFV